jgi:hypothetical protein
MEPTKRMVAAGDAWDRLPKETVSLIAVKVAETLEDPSKTFIVRGCATR